MIARLVFVFFLAFSEIAFAEISGRIHFQEDEFYGSQIQPIDHLQDDLSFEVESKNKINDSIRILIEPKVHVYSDRHIVDTDLDFNPRDSLIEFKYDDYHLQIGSFIKQWEGPDGYNPMDIATVKDYRDPLATESLGSTGINLFSGNSKFNWDAFYIPLQTEARLPGDSSRWLPRKTPVSTSVGDEHGSFAHGAGV